MFVHKPCNGVFYLGSGECTMNIINVNSTHPPLFDPTVAFIIDQQDWAFFDNKPKFTKKPLNVKIKIDFYKTITNNETQNKCLRK